MSISCPKCHFSQEGGEECLRCGIIFRKYKPLPSPSAEHAGRSPSKPDPHSNESVLRFKQDASEKSEHPSAEETEELVFESEKRRRPRRVLRTVLRVIPWISLTAAIGAIYLIFQQTPPIQVQRDPNALQRVDRKMQQLQIAAQVGRPYTLSLDEAELNAWLNANLALQSQGREAVRGITPDMNIPVDDPRFQETQSAMKDIRVNLSGDTLRAYALFDFHGRNLSLLLEGRVRVRDGYLRLEPTGGRIGSLPIPKITLERVVDRLFDSPQNRESFRLSPEINTVDIRQGRLFVMYR